MRAYKGSFVKKNGDLRVMYFAELEDLPEAFLDAKTTGTGTSPRQKEGSKLVWDLQYNSFKVFNTSTQTGEVEQFEFDENKLV